MVLKFRKNSIYVLCGKMMLFMPFIFPLLTQLIKFPLQIKYIMDIACFLLLIFLFVNSRNRLNKQWKIFYIWICVFFLITLVTYLFNYQSIFYYLWGLRNNFRGYILFLGVLTFFKKRDVYEILKLLDVIFWINLFVTFFQFFILGINQDNLGGIFGVESGCNGYTNVFFCVYLVISMIQYFYKDKNLINLISAIGFMLVVAAMAELKFFYVELIILILLSNLITDFSLKKLLIIVPIILCFFIGYKVFLTVFPNIDLSINGMYEYATSDKGYTARGDLNRLSFVPQVNNLFLTNNWKKSFGLGLGNCDYATGIDLVTSPFSKSYGWMHYAWMSTSFIYLEMGWTGLFFFFGFFVVNFIKSLTKSKNNKDKKYFQIAALCCVIGVLNGFYNISMRLEICYLLYFLLAIPWVLDLQIQNGED